MGAVFLILVHGVWLHCVPAFLLSGIQWFWGSVAKLELLFGYGLSTSPKDICARDMFLGVAV